MNELATQADIRECFGRLEGCVFRDDMKTVEGYRESGEFFGDIARTTINASIFIEITNRELFWTQETYDFLHKTLTNMGFEVIKEVSNNPMVPEIVEIRRLEIR